MAAPYTKRAASSVRVRVRTSERHNQYAAIPHELRAYDQFVVFAVARPDTSGKQKKIPCNPHTGRPAPHQDRSIWLSFADAVRIYASNSRFAGIGFVFTQDDPFVGIDLDDCYDTGQLDERAAGIVKALNSYTEISISGRGVKAIVEASAINPTIDKQHKGIEIYAHNRFFALTGNALANTPGEINNAQAGIDGLIARYAAQEAPQRAATVARARSASNIKDNPIEAYLQAYDLFCTLELYGCKQESKKVWHCSCGVHTGASGSLIISRSPKYGYVVKGMNPSCALFYGNLKACVANAFEVMRLLGYNGDITAAIAEARRMLDMPIEYERRAVAFTPKKSAPAAVKVVANPAATMGDVLRLAVRDEMKKSERKVLNALIDHAPDGVTQLTIAQIASLAGISESSVHAANRRLAGRYYTITEDATDAGGNIANVYTFINPQEKIKEIAPPPATAEIKHEAAQNTEIAPPYFSIKESKGDQATIPPAAAQPDAPAQATDSTTALDGTPPLLSLRPVAHSHRYFMKHYQRYHDETAPADGFDGLLIDGDDPVDQPIEDDTPPAADARTAPSDSAAVIDVELPIIDVDAPQAPEDATYTPVPDGCYIDDTGETRPMLDPEEWRYNEAPSKAQWRIAERKIRHTEDAPQDKPRRRWGNTTPVVLAEQPSMVFDAGDLDDSVNAGTGLAALRCEYDRLVKEGKRNFARNAPTAAKQCFARAKVIKDRLSRNGTLVAGLHRLEACKLLGWERIPVTFIDLSVTGSPLR